MPEQKVILITGASSGLGQVTAQYLAQQGHRVFGTSRNPAQAQAVGFTMLPLDVRSLDSIQACLQTIADQAERLDVLINNAGFIGPAAAFEEMSLAQIKSLFETNFFGVIQMTNAVLPGMRRQGSGQIINVSSAAGLMPMPLFTGAYVASKHALEGYTEELRLEVRPFNIRVSLIEPGYFKTNITQSAQPPERALEAYTVQRQQALEVDQSSIELGRDPRLVAQAIARAVHSRSPRLRYAVGLDAAVMTMAKRVLPDALFERIIIDVFLANTAPARALRSIVLDTRKADALWRSTWLALALSAAAALIVGARRKKAK